MRGPRRCELAGAIRARVRSELAMKVALSVILPVVFCVFYFGLQRLVLFPLRSVPSTWIDARIPFDPRWVWPYQSIYLLMPILPWLARRREELWRYLGGWAILCGISFAIFFLAPTRGPEQVAHEHPGYRFLLSYVGQLNALPSLHAGLTVYTFLFGYRLFRDELSAARRAVYVVIAVAWTLSILYGTLATKMHWVHDLSAGTLAAWIGHALAWRGVDEAETEATAPRPAAVEDLSRTGD